MSEDTAKIVEDMLSGFSHYSVLFGGLEFYGSSPEFSDLIQLCREFTSPPVGDPSNPHKAYLFIEPFHGKTSIAKATDIDAKKNGFASYYFDGTVGVTQKQIKDLQVRADVVVLVDGVPEAAASRRLLLERFNALAGKALLFANPEYYADANLDQNIPKLRLSHIDSRPVDKLAWLIGAIRENLRADNGIIPTNLERALATLSAKAFVSLTGVPLGPRVKDLPSLGKRIAEALQLRVNLDPDLPFTQEDLLLLFMSFYSSGVQQAANVFRLWVEGDTDSRILKLVSRLVNLAHGTTLEEGLSILPLGEGREGGTSKTIGIVLAKQTRKNKDVFLLDFDNPGRQAAEELKVLGQDVVLLDPKLSCSRSDSDAEIEDFISLACLDRFYESNPDCLPEREIIRYKDPKSRRVVVDGGDKERLVIWLESNAALTEVENLFLVMCEIRARFSLNNPFSATQLQAWRKKLEYELIPDKHHGNLPNHWGDKPTATPNDVASVIARELTVEEDAIRQLAYQLYEQRGCVHGFDREDWMRAEAELKRKKLA